MLVPNKNPQRYTEYVISFISFAFGEVVTTIYFLANVKLYVSNIEESYKERIIGNLVNSVTADSLLHKIQCWRACAVDEEKRNLPLVMYCLCMMYKFYYRLVFLLIKHNKE